MPDSQIIEGLRIDELDELAVITLPAADEIVLPVMRNGRTYQITVSQILDLLVGTAPAVLDTIEELSEALGNDENFAAAIATQIAALTTSIAVNASAIADNASDILTNASDIATNASDIATTNASRIGHGQTWQNVKPIRVLGSTYMNLTARPIQILVSILLPGGVSAQAFIYLNGVGPKRVGINGNTNSVITVVSAIIPPGHTYSLVCAAGSIDEWMELR